MTRRFALLLALALTATSLHAQADVGRERGTAGVRAEGPQAEMSFEDQLIPPELIMQHQGDIGLTAQQRATITDAVKGLQGQVVEFQWQMQAEQQKLAEMLSQPSVQETTALAQIDRVLDLERQVKKAHLAALIRIKNTLTPEQQQQLLTLRRRGPAR
jgi:Spy/CpxP family protein refolding chaperone